MPPPVGNPALRKAFESAIFYFRDISLHQSTERVFDIGMRGLRLSSQFCP